MYTIAGVHVSVHAADGSALHKSVTPKFRSKKPLKRNNYNGESFK